MLLIKSSKIRNWVMLGVVWNWGDLELDNVGGGLELDRHDLENDSNGRGPELDEHVPKLDAVDEVLDNIRHSESLHSDADTVLSQPANSDEISLFVNDDDEDDFNISHNMMDNKTCSKLSSRDKGKGKNESSESKRKSRPHSPHRSKRKKKHHSRKSSRRNSLERHNSGKSSSERRDSRKTSCRSSLERHKKSRRSRSRSREMRSGECHKRHHKRKHRLRSTSRRESVTSSIVSVSPPGRLSPTKGLLASPRRGTVDGIVLVSPPLACGGGSSLLKGKTGLPVSPQRGNIDSVVLILPPESANGGSSPFSPPSGKAESLQMSNTDVVVSPPRRGVRRKSSISPPRVKARGISTSVSPPRKNGSVSPSSSRGLEESPLQGRNMSVVLLVSGDSTSTGSSESPPHVLAPHAGNVARKYRARQGENRRRDIGSNDTGHMTAKSRGSKGRADPLTCGLATPMTVRCGKPSGVGRRDPLTYCGGADRGKDLLVQEAKNIEEEIRSSKRELLKSVLKKERIELLHRNLHGKPVSGDRRVSKKGGMVGNSERKLQDELMQLNEEIMIEKRQLLKVVKRMEEERADADSSDL